MKLYGLQKMTLLDFPEHVACTVFLGGCDFRCPFCHNYELAEGKAPVVMEEEEFFRFMAKRHGLLDGVAITGGEPCIYRELPAFMARIKEEGFAVKLDTNGYHPELLRQILSEGLADYVAMDIKNSPEKYARTAGVAHVDLAKIRESIAMLTQEAPDYEFRTTLVAQFHEETDIHEMGKMIRGAKRYFLQSFIDREQVPFEGFSAPSAQELAQYLAVAREYVPAAQMRGS